MTDPTQAEVPAGCTFTEAVWADAVKETNRLCYELDITNADHIVLWLEHQLDGIKGPLAYIACRILEAHEAAQATATPSTSVQGAGEATWLIRRGGAFFRPDAAGYTTHVVAAGLYTREEADRYADVEGVTIHPVEEYRAEAERAVAGAQRVLAALSPPAPASAVRNNNSGVETFTDRHDRAETVTASVADEARAREAIMRALWAELDRQCAIGAGTWETDGETGLMRISADIDPHGMASALAFAARPAGEGER